MACKGLLAYRPSLAAACLTCMSDLAALLNVAPVQYEKLGMTSHYLVYEDMFTQI